MAEGVPVSTLSAWLRTCYGGAERTAEAAPAEIERYFVECECLRDQGASADQLHALSHSYGVCDAPLSHAAERVYMSPVDTRRDGVVATGAVTRYAHVLADRSTLEDCTLMG